MTQMRIKALGALGDGIADGAGEMQFVPFALPGETWNLDDDGTAALVTAAADRADSACPHFMVCGGCRAQHMPTEIYAAWKRQRVVDALAQANVVVAAPGGVAPIVLNGYGTRRRAAVAAIRTTSGIVLGYHERASHSIVDIERCPIWVEELEAGLPALRAIAKVLCPPTPNKPGQGELRLQVLATRAGLDVHAIGASGDPDARARAKLSEIATREGIARLVVDQRDVVQIAEPTLMVDDVALVPHPGAFLQATAVAEQEMTARIVALVGKAKRVADLFCGVGTFALALSRTVRVAAIDSDQDAIKVMTAAHRTTQGRKPVDPLVRDLFREPLARRELDVFDVVVFDPPRAGAKAQCEQLAKSKVTNVIAVSCNPVTFARDAKLLIDGGYTLQSVVPIDQFAFSEHVELVAQFTRPRERRPK